MEELLKEAQELLTQNVGANFHLYRSLYKKIFNKEASGCKCQGYNIQNEIKEWYIRETNKINNK